MSKIISFLFYFYSLLVVLFPAADLIVNKKLLFILIFSIYFLTFLLNYNKKINLLNIYRILIIFTILIFGSIFSFNDREANFIFLITSCLPLLLILFLDDSINYIKLIKFLGFILSITVIFCVVSPFIGHSLFNKIQNLFLSLDSGFWGSRQFGSLNLIMIHFRTSPILIIPFSFCFIEFCDKKRKRDFILLFLNGLGIIFSASRGLILFSFVSLFLICLFNYKIKIYRFFLLLFIFVAVISIVFLLNFTNVFDITEKSNSIKISHVKSFFALILDKPYILLFGDGTGSSYFTSGFNRIAWQTEITFLDMIRYWGIFGMLIILFCFIYYKKSIIEKKYTIPFILYIFSAALNPLIFNSTGMLVITIYILMVSNQGKVK